MTNNKLPSHWQLGDKVSVFETGVISEVSFREGKVFYTVDVGPSEFMPVTERYVPSEQVAAPIDSYS